MNQLGFGSDRGRNGIGIGCVDVSETQAIVDKHFVEEPRRPAIHIVRTHHVITRLHHRAKRSDSGHSRSKAVRRTAALKRAQVLLQRVAGWIGQARVLVALVLPNRLLLVRRGEIDGYIDRAGERISLLTIVDGASGKALFRIGHHSMVSNCREKGSRANAPDPRSDNLCVMPVVLA